MTGSGEATALGEAWAPVVCISVACWCEAMCVAGLILPSVNLGAHGAGCDPLCFLHDCENLKQSSS